MRHRLPARLASATRAEVRAEMSESAEITERARVSAALDPADEADTYAAEIAAGFEENEKGVVSMEFGVARNDSLDAETALDHFDREEKRALVRAQDPSSFPDQSTAEMMAQLRKEADAYVNPQTGEALRWGDTWRHEWGGGVGVGRPDRVSRRMMSDGVTMIVPSATEKSGFALVPTSSDRRALEEFYDECNGARWSVQKNWLVGEPCANGWHGVVCLLYTSPSPRDATLSRMPSSA